MTRSNDSGRWRVIWEVATKFFLATYPFAISWAVWVSSEIWTAKATYIPRAEYRTAIDLIDDRLDAMPPAEWKDRIEKMDNKMDKLFDEVISIRVLVAGKSNQASK